MSKKERLLRYGAIGILGLFIVIAVLTFLYAVWVLFTFNPGKVAAKDSTLIYDREENLLYTIHGEENRESLDSLDQIAPSLVDATIAIEDDNFYHHIGIDIPALAKAFLSQLGIGTPRGGSTITQQLVKNSLLSSEQTYIRKYREIITALVLELKFSKDDILLMYLNEIPYGNNAYGIELAAKRYFGKDATELTLGESAILASIPKAPTRYSPYGNYKYSVLSFELTEENLQGRSIKGEEDLSTDEFTRGLLGTTFTLPDASTFYIKGRSDLVLDRMMDLGMITESEKTAALAEIQTIAFTDYKELDQAAHFVLWVKQQLEEKYGSEIVEQGGLKVYTTLDPDFQKGAEEAIAEQIESNTKTYGANNAALVSIQPQTGQILAMVGSADWGNSDIDGQVNMITSYRQPGSAFKPFVYSLALLNQYTAATVFYDVLTHFGSDTPKNFSGTFSGPLPMRQALGNSLNIPAAKAYFLAGEEQGIVPFVNKFGLDLDPNHSYGYPLALGAAEVTPLEFAEAYGVFANGGYKVEPTAILRVEASDGQNLEQWDEKKVEKIQVLDPQVAYIINDILSDPSVNLGSAMYLSALDNAAKTGTSTDDDGYPQDGWIVAYTPTLVTIGWSGNANGDPMFSNGEAYFTIAPIWKNYMTKILNRLEPTEWVRPAGIKEVAISKASGKLPSQYTPSDMIRTEIFADFAVPSEQDDSYQVVKVENISGRLATPYSPADSIEEKTYRVHKEDWINWQSDIDAWAETQGEEGRPPTEYADDIHNAETAANIPELAITSPTSLSSLSSSERWHDVEVEILDTGNGIKEVQYLLDGDVKFHANEAPYTGRIPLPASAGEGTILELTAKIIDQYGYSSESTIQVRVGDSSKSSDSSKDSGSGSGILDLDSALLPKARAR